MHHFHMEKIGNYIKGNECFNESSSLPKKSKLKETGNLGRDEVSNNRKIKSKKNNVTVKKDKVEHKSRKLNERSAEMSSKDAIVAEKRHSIHKKGDYIEEKKAKRDYTTTKYEDKVKQEIINKCATPCDNAKMVIDEAAKILIKAAKDQKVGDLAEKNFENLAHSILKKVQYKFSCERSTLRKFFKKIGSDWANTWGQVWEKIYQDINDKQLDLSDKVECYVNELCSKISDLNWDFLSCDAKASAVRLIKYIVFINSLNTGHNLITNIDMGILVVVLGNIAITEITSEENKEYTLYHCKMNSQKVYGVKFRINSKILKADNSKRLNCEYLERNGKRLFREDKIFKQIDRSIFLKKVAQDNGDCKLVALGEDQREHVLSKVVDETERCMHNGGLGEIIKPLSSVSETVKNTIAEFGKSFIQAAKDQGVALGKNVELENIPNEIIKEIKNKIQDSYQTVCSNVVNFLGEASKKRSMEIVNNFTKMLLSEAQEKKSEEHVMDFIELVESEKDIEVNFGDVTRSASIKRYIKRLLMLKNLCAEPRDSIYFNSNLTLELFSRIFDVSAVKFKQQGDKKKTYRIFKNFKKKTGWSSVKYESGEAGSWKKPCCWDKSISENHKESVKNAIFFEKTENYLRPVSKEVKEEEAPWLKVKQADEEELERSGTDFFSWETMSKYLPETLEDVKRELLAVGNNLKKVDNTIDLGEDKILTCVHKLTETINTQLGSSLSNIAVAASANLSGETADINKQGIRKGLLKFLKKFFYEENFKFLKKEYTDELVELTKNIDQYVDETNIKNAIKRFLHIALVRRSLYDKTISAEYIDPQFLVNVYSVPMLEISGAGEDLCKHYKPGSHSLSMTYKKDLNGIWKQTGRKNTVKFQKIITESSIVVKKGNHGLKFLTKREIKNVFSMNKK